MTTKLAPLDEKGGHKIHRQITEEFTPWCAICKRVVSDMVLDTENEARRILVAHLVMAHKESLEVMKLATSG